MSFQKLLSIKEEFEKFGWEVSDLDGSNIFEEMLEISSDGNIHWKISRKNVEKKLLFFLSDSLGNRTTNLSDVFWVSCDDDDRIKLFFDAKMNNDWQKEVKKFVCSFDKFG